MAPLQSLRVLILSGVFHRLCCFLIMFVKKGKYCRLIMFYLCDRWNWHQSDSTPGVNNKVCWEYSLQTEVLLLQTIASREDHSIVWDYFKQFSILFKGFMLSHHARVWVSRPLHVLCNFCLFFPSSSCFIFPSVNSNEALARCKQRIELIANTLELEGFSRIDAFVNVDSGAVCWFHDFTGQITPMSALLNCKFWQY